MSISKIFIPNFVGLCVLTKKGVGLRGAGGVKNFSVGTCDGAPSTARFSLMFKMAQPVFA